MKLTPRPFTVLAMMQVGLRGADLLEWGLDYARRKTGGS